MNTNRMLAAGCALGAIATLLVMGGPLNPPPGPVAPTGVTLAEIQQAVQNVQNGLPDPTVGYIAAGFPPDAPMTTSWTSLVAGRSGIIKKVIVSFHGGSFTDTYNAVELRVDGQNYVGLFRPVAGTTSGGASIAYVPSYDINVRFNSSVEAKMAASSNNQPKPSIAIHYLPLSN